MTGATGFVGSHLLRSLVADGRDITILCRSYSDTRRISDVLARVRRINLDKVVLPEALSSLKFAGVLHLATDYGRSSSVTDVLRTNLLLPVELLDTAIALEARFFINTDSFYSKPSSHYPALATYTFSKSWFLDWACNKVTKIHVANVCLEHVYGTEDGIEKFVPHILSQLRNNAVDEIQLTLGKQRRDFVFVSDVVAAYRSILSAAECAQPSCVSYEVGTGTSVEIREFVEKLHNATGSNAKLNFGALPYRAGEIMESTADLRTLTAIGYQPQISLDAGISRLLQN